MKPKRSVLSMDPLKLMLSRYNLLAAIDLSHWPVAVFPITPTLVILSLCQHSQNSHGLTDP